MLPTSFPISLANFNYTSVAVGGMLGLIMIGWLTSAHKWFTAPRVDVDNSDAVLIKYWVADPPTGAT